jgi:hypothetical protein
MTFRLFACFALSPPSGSCAEAHRCKRFLCKYTVGEHIAPLQELFSKEHARIADALQEAREDVVQDTVLWGVPLQLPAIEEFGPPKLFDFSLRLDTEAASPQAAEQQVWIRSSAPVVHALSQHTSTEPSRMTGGNCMCLTALSPCIKQQLYLCAGATPPHPVHSRPRGVQAPGDL